MEIYTEMLENEGKNVILTPPAGTMEMERKGEIMYRTVNLLTKKIGIA